MQWIGCGPAGQECLCGLKEQVACDGLVLASGNKGILPVWVLYGLLSGIFLDSLDWLAGGRMLVLSLVNPPGSPLDLTDWLPGVLC